MTGSSITPESVVERRDRSSKTVPSISGSATRLSAQDHEEIRILTFAELKALIEEGKTDLIPNNKDIPEALSVRIIRAISSYVVIVVHNRMSFQANL